MDDAENKQFPPCMIGTWAWGSGMNGSRMVFGKSYDKDKLIGLFEYAYERGFTAWDTASVYGYGNAEKLLGECIHKLSSDQKLYLSTKFMPSKKYKEGAMEDQLKESMSRLGISVPDIYWIHIPNDLLQNLKNAIQLQKAGKIKSIGLSNVSMEEIVLADEMLQKEGLSIGGIQNHYSLLSRMNGQEEIISWCHEHQVRYFSYMVLEQGALSGHYDREHPFPFLSMRGFSFPKKKLIKIEPLIKYQRELAKKYEIAVAQIPFLWAVEKGTVPIVGVTKIKYIDEMIQALKVKLLPDEIRELEQIALSTGVYCKGAWEPHK